MAKTEKPFMLNTFNRVIIILLRLGVKIGNMTLLTVRGRKSGQLRTTPIAVTEENGQRWVISPYGQVQWVRNLRAAGEGILTRGRRSERVRAIELSVQEAAPILKRTLAGAPAFLRAYFDVTPDSPLEDFEREAERHPVFRFEAFSEQDTANSSSPVGKAIVP